VPKGPAKSNKLGQVNLKDFERVITWQRVEGLAMMGFFSYLFSTQGVAWWWFPLVLLAIDISIVGYAFGNRAGAFVYNLGHTSIIAVSLLTLGQLHPSVVAFNVVGFTWLAHIGMDRAFGFGLKMHRGFRHTHLGMIGKPAKK
jgi:hypothetical protein